MGGTVFGPRDLHWFGFKGPHVPREEQVEILVAELERFKRAGPGENANVRDRKLHRFLCSIRNVRGLAEKWADHPDIARKKPEMDNQTEQRISELKRQLSAWANKTNQAARQHEDLRQELLHLLAKHHISPSNYKEAMRLRLDD